jgi:hypothetical protein
MYIVGMNKIDAVIAYKGAQGASQRLNRERRSVVYGLYSIGQLRDIDGEPAFVETAA